MTITGEFQVVAPKNCPDCDQLIKEKLSAMAGVEDVSVDLHNSKVAVRFDGNTRTLTHLKQALMEEGFTVMEI